MKSKELIRLLQEADPTGEVEVGVGNIDIFSVEPMPAYYDGRFQKLIRDEKLAPYFDVVGAKYCSHGSKIKLIPMSVTDVLWDNPDAEIDYSDLGSPDSEYVKQMKQTDDITREASRNVELSVEIRAFQEWVAAKAALIRPGEESKGTAEYFYRKYLSPKDPVKDLPPKKQKMGGFMGIGAKEYEVWPSWSERRAAMWDDTIEVSWGGGWKISKKGTTDAIED